MTAPETPYVNPATTVDEYFANANMPRYQMVGTEQVDNALLDAANAETMASLSPELRAQFEALVTAANAQADAAKVEVLPPIPQPTDKVSIPISAVLPTPLGEPQNPNLKPGTSTLGSPPPTPPGVVADTHLAVPVAHIGMIHQGLIDFENGVEGAWEKLAVLLRRL